MAANLGPVDESGTAANSRTHIARLQNHLAEYSSRLALRAQCGPKEYADHAHAVLENLISAAPATSPRKVGLFPMLGRPRSPFEWVRFPPLVNKTLHQFAKSRGVMLTARHKPVPRDPRSRPSRVEGLYPKPYDWGWRCEDFRRRGVGAQPWEATLAADFETAVAGPLRRALRAAPRVAAYLKELRPVEEIQLDLDAAEAFLCEKLRLPRPAGEALSETWAPNLAGPRSLALPDGHPDLWQALLARLLAALEIRLQGCASEYMHAAALLRDRLDPDRARLWQGPVLAPRVLVPPGLVVNPIIRWQAAKPGHRLDPADPRAKGWRDLPWNSSQDRAKYRSYSGSCCVRRESPCPADEFYWFTEAKRLVKDFAPAQMWERWFALHYDRTVVTPLRRQWLLARWSVHLQGALVNPDRCRLQLNIEKYLPHVL